MSVEYLERAIKLSLVKPEYTMTVFYLLVTFYLFSDTLSDVLSRFPNFFTSISLISASFSIFLALSYRVEYYIISLGLSIVLGLVDLLEILKNPNQMLRSNMLKSIILMLIWILCALFVILLIGVYVSKLVLSFYNLDLIRLLKDNFIIILIAMIPVFIHYVITYHLRWGYSIISAYPGNRKIFYWFFYLLAFSLRPPSLYTNESIYIYPLLLKEASIKNNIKKVLRTLNKKYKLEKIERVPRVIPQLKTKYVIYEGDLLICVICNYQNKGNFLIGHKLKVEPIIRALY